MKIFKFTAFVLAAALALAPAAGCKHDIKSSSETVKNNEEVFTSPEELVRFLNRADDDTIVNVSVEIKGSGVVAGGDGYG